MNAPDGDSGAFFENEVAARNDATPRMKPWRLAQLIALVGVIYGVLFTLSFWLLSDVPGAGSSEQEVFDYYSGDNQRVISFVALYLLPFAGIAFLWFIVLVRMWISHHAERQLNLLLSNVQLVSGVVFIALFFAAAAAISTASLTAELEGEQLDPVDALQFPQYGGALFFVFAMRMAAMFTFSSMSLLRGGEFPKWFIVFGYAVGLFLLLSASFNRALVLVFPLWVLLVCVMVILQARNVRQSTSGDTHDKSATSDTGSGPARETAS